MQQTRDRLVGHVMMIGGALGVALAPAMVAIKYMTGWAIVPEPFWVPAARAWFGVSFAGMPPHQLWMVFGTAYSVALLLMFAGFVTLAPTLQGRSRAQRTGYWLVAGGLTLVLPGDAIHTWTWHQHGLTIPTPGTNPVANGAYAAHMMGMNLVMAGTLLLGLAALRHGTLARWVSFMFILVFPAAVLAAVTILPTTPSGALWLFGVLMIAAGGRVARGGSLRPTGQASSFVARRA